MLRYGLPAVVVLLSGASGFADVRLPALFGERMVLQRNKPITIWGWADAGERVHISFDKVAADTVADRAGKWRLTLPQHAAGGPFELIVDGKNHLQFKDVLVGEVWICSGQSNMEFQVRQTVTADETLKSPAIPTLRLFRLEKLTADQPVNDCKAQWLAATPENIDTFSAVGFYFGKDLQSRLNVPVGLIQSSWGGTPAEAWTDRASLQAVPSLKPIFDHAAEMAAAVPKTQELYKQHLAEHEAAVAKAKAAGKKPPANLKKPVVLQQEKYPATLFNGMVAPIAGYTASGVLWYQGEANAKRHAQYQILLPTMIQSWREAWRDPALPFAIVQLPRFGPVTDDAVEDAAWTAQRESQAIVAKSVPGVDYTCNIDLGDPDDEHAKAKAAFGRRLCNWAMAKIYGETSIDWAGPRYESMRVVGSTVHIAFKLSHPPLRTIDGKPPFSFAIAGEDQKFVAAVATIDGDQIVLHADAVPHPKAVRYAWTNSPMVNLVDEQNLPLAPFRTDDWPLQDESATPDTP